MTALISSKLYVNYTRNDEYYVNICIAHLIDKVGI